MESLKDSATKPLLNDNGMDGTLEEEKTASPELEFNNERSTVIGKHKINGNDNTTEKDEVQCNTTEEGEIPKKKRKKKETPPQIQYDLEDLFSNNGKRPGATHLTFKDIRSLIMLKVHGERFPCFPNWCKLTGLDKIRHALVLMVGCVSEEEYNRYKDCFTYLNSSFDRALPVKLEGSDHLLKSPLKSFLTYRMPKRLQEEKILENEYSEADGDTNAYLLKENQLRGDNFPEWNSAAIEHGVISTRKNGKRTFPTATSGMYAIDCEMCITRTNEHALTRISIVDKEMNVVLDKLVKPKEPVTDYVTKYSGITAEMLENITTTLADVQRDILKAIKEDDIVIGHSLDFDLRALQFHHDNIIDTSHLFPDARGARYKSSLRNLAKKYLNKDIQNSESGHCSIEDAKTCMQLVLLKLDKGSSLETPENETEGVFEALNRAGKRGAMIDIPYIVKQYSFGNTHSVPCLSDEQVVSNTKRYVKEVDLTFSHIRRFDKLIKDKQTIDGKLEEKEIQTCLKSIDKDIEEILEVAPSRCLVIVGLCSGHVSPDVMKLVRDKETRKREDVKEAINKAKHGTFFVKVTS